MQRYLRLRRGLDIRGVYASRQSLGGTYLVLHFRPNGLENSRFGFAISARLAKAVRRNLLRRRLRATAQKLAPTLSKMDVVVVARPGALEASYAELEEELRRLLARAGQGGAAQPPAG